MNSKTNETIFPDQRVSLKEKQNPDWYIPTINYIIDRALACNNKTEIQICLDAAEGIIDSSTFDYVMKPYGKDDPTVLNGEIRNVSFITPIKDRYMGEFIRQYHNYQVYMRDTETVILMNKEFKKQLEQLIAQQLINTLNQNGQDTGQESSPVKDPEQFAKDFYENWRDERIDQYQNVLNLFNDRNDSDVMYSKAFYYWWATEEVYSYRTVVGKDVHKEIVSPLEYYRIPTNNIFVEDDDMGVRKYNISLNQINTEYKSELSESDLLFIRTIKESERPINTAQLLKSRNDFSTISTLTDGCRNLQQNLSANDLSSFKTCYHIVWKSERKQGILTYIDMIGNISTTIVDEEYEINPELGDLDIRWDWVNCVMEARLFGEKFIGLYTKPYIIKPQRTDILNNDKVKLPYNGLSGILNNEYRNPIPKRLLGYEALYRIYKLQQERAIAKYKAGYFVFPESLLASSKELSKVHRLKFSKRDDILTINDSDANANSLQALRFISGSATERYISVLSELQNQLKQEAWDLSNMNEQRFGDINGSAGKSTTEYAISRASTGSILLFSLFNSFREKDYVADIDHLKVAWIDGKQDAYYDKAEGKLVIVNIDGAAFYNSNIGVSVRNSQIDDEELKQYKDLAFAAAQNGDTDIAADAIHIKNASKLRKLIKDATVARREHEMELQQMQQASNEKIAEQNKASADMQMQVSQQQLEYKETMANEREYIKADAQIMLERVKQHLGSPDDVSSDIEEFERKVKEHEMKILDREQNRKEFETREKIKTGNKALTIKNNGTKK